VTGSRLTLAIAAPAKINLYLHVTGRRADGYHFIDSLMAFTEAGDRIVVRPAEDLRLEVQGRFAPVLGAGEDNLVLRAARALSERTGVRPRAHITLVKELPVASGIGGGSSDAAATLKVLAAHWQIDSAALADAEWAAVRLGADVPVCLFAAPAQVSGIGEVVRPASDLPACAVVLVNPGVAVPTGAVFARRVGPFSVEGSLPRATDLAALAARLAERRNDLTDAAQSIAPAVGHSLQALAQSQGCRLARMSGSGATCFGLYDDDTAAGAAARAIVAAHPDWWVCATRFRKAPPIVETG
jgi:4-diphosphocytidyl-2-C-methyl-D-erythritol kinase